MKTLSSLLCLSSLCGSLLALSPPPLKAHCHFAPISALLVDSPAQEPIWIEGKVLSQEEDDVYLIEDATAKIRIFLSLDELLGYSLLPGDHVAVWGKVDKSSVGAEKNEFYVEKMFLK